MYHRIGWQLQHQLLKAAELGLMARPFQESRMESAELSSQTFFCWLVDIFAVHQVSSFGTVGFSDRV
jgi:hypothetical protein